jgi:hypothetical protein
MTERATIPNGPIRSAVKAVLPTGSSFQVDSLHVEAGHAVFPNSERYPDSPPLGWAIDRISESSDSWVWDQLVEAFSETGLWPVVGGEHDYNGPAWQRHTLWRDDPTDRPTDIRGLFGLDRREEWEIQEDDFCFECGTVIDRSGELAIPGEEPDLDRILRMTSWDWSSRPILLAAVERPADAIAAIGWTGGTNAGWLGGDAVYVLRSWEERFGAYLFMASGSRLTLLVTRPPRTLEEARMVAREHFHFCRYDSQFHGIGGIGPYVQRLVGAERWEFWWD